MEESRWLRAVTLCVNLYLGWILQSPAHGGNLVINGSFEIRQAGEPNKYIDTLTPDRADLVGWQVTGKSIDWIGPTRWKASHGEHCLDIDAPGGIRQTVKTTPGREYQLQFDLAGNVETEPLKKVLRVSINGDHRDFSFDAAGHTRQQLGWVRKQIVFVAQGGKTTLWFSNASPKATASGVALDNVVVAEVKPSQYTVRTTAKGTILVDSASGQTWMLMPYQGKTAWLPVETVDPLERLRQLGAKVSVKDDIVRDVDLTDSTITDTDMEIFNSLSALEHLTLNGCRQLTDAGLVHLRRLTGLKGLGLERTNVTDAGLANLSGLSELDYLSLNWTRVGDAGLRHLSGLANLEVLYLCDTSTADAGLMSLRRMSKLQWLDLRGTQVTDAGLSHLSNLPHLRLLSLFGTRVTDAGVPALTELSNLEVLTLGRTQVTDAGLLPLTKLPRLKELDLTGTNVTQAGVDRLQRALPDCRVRFQVASEASKPVVQ
jgi:choice-of-anchor C domain-containing protein